MTEKYKKPAHDRGAKTIVSASSMRFKGRKSVRKRDNKSAEELAEMSGKSFFSAMAAERRKTLAPGFYGSVLRSMDGRDGRKIKIPTSQLGDVGCPRWLTAGSAMYTDPPRSKIAGEDGYPVAVDSLPSARKNRCHVPAIPQSCVNPSYQSRKPNQSRCVKFLSVS